MKKILVVFIFVSSSACAQHSNTHTEEINNFPQDQRSTKTEAEWRAQLSDAQYYILREAGTERAFTSPLNNNKKKGIYACAACSLPLFESQTKFNSGTGWPSFYQPINKINVAESVDKSYGMVRTEVHCARCDGHLGHVFPDGPDPTGLRYCINGLSLDFQPQ